MWTKSIKKEEEEEEEEEDRVPTAVERVDFARRALHEGQPIWKPKSKDFYYLVCHDTAQNLLRSTEFVKPYKSNPLLSSSLTNANGNDWHRQRLVVQRAFQNREARKLAVQASIQAAINCFSHHNHDTLIADARKISLDVAQKTIPILVFSEKYASKLSIPVQNLFLPTLQQSTKGSQVREHLNEIVVEILDEMKNKIQDAPQQHDNVQPCLAKFLLLAASEGKLSHKEVVANCHSALIAGIQTISTNLTGCMAHLAELRDLTTLNGKNAVCFETLRILPPVASLPRCPLLPLELKCSNSSINIDPDEMLLFDLLAFAHVNGNDTWRFCPASTHHKKSSPWGIGTRRCPAGMISVECVSAVLDCILSSHNLALVNPDVDSVGDDGKAGWVGRVSYRPTLVYHNPIMLSFCRK